MKSTRKRMRLTDLNPNLTCMLCRGYFIDATTIIECLHSFCKSCIVKHLKTNKHCPVCNVMVHKTKPHLNIRSDKTLQDLVYKLVPGLYKVEMKRRRDYYSQHPHETPSKVGEERGDENAERILYTEDDKFSLALHFCDQGVKDERSVRTLTLPEVGASTTEAIKNVRYLQCPAGVTMDILKKFVRIKYELPHKYQIDIFHSDKALRDDFTLVDVAYLYTWRRKEPLKLHFSVYEFIMKRRKMNCTITTKRLLDPSNLIKREAKNPPPGTDATRSESKPDTAKPGTGNDSDKSGGGTAGDKMGRQSDGGQQEEGKEGHGNVKDEHPGKDTRTLEAMDTSSSSPVNNGQPCVDLKPGKFEPVEAALEVVQESSSRTKTEKKAAETASTKRDVSAAGSKTVEQEKKAVMKTMTGSATPAVTSSSSPSTPLPTTSTVPTIATAIAAATTIINNSPSKATTPSASTLTTHKVVSFRKAPNSPATVSPAKRKCSESPARVGSIGKQIANMAKKPAPVSGAKSSTAGGPQQPTAVTTGSQVAAVAGAGRGQNSVASVEGSETQGDDSSKTQVTEEAARAGTGAAVVAVAASASASRKTPAACLQPPAAATTTLAPHPVAPNGVRTAALAVRSTGTTARSVASTPRSAAVQVPRSSGAAASVTYVSTQPNKTTCSSPSPSKPKPPVVAAASSALPSSIPPARAHLSSSHVSSSNNNNANVVVPSAAAGAASAASPSPAALAASSSPSPPMAGSAASVKDSMEQALKLPISSATPRPDASTTAKSVVTSLAFKPTPSAASPPSTLSSSVSVASSASFVAAVADTSKPVVLKKASSPSTTTKNCASSSPSTEDQQSVSCEDNSKKTSTPGLNTAGVAGVKERTDGGGHGSGGNQTSSGDKNKMCVNGSNNDTTLVKPAKDIGAYSVGGGDSSSSKTINNNQRVVMPGRPSIASLTAGGPALLSGRNGMPTVVTKPTRGVSNASTSVNTLLHHKLPALASPTSSASASTGHTQRSAPAVGVAKTSDAVPATSTSSPVSSRPCGTASPACKQQQQQQQQQPLTGRSLVSPDTSAVSRPSPCQTVKTSAHTVKESVPRSCAPGTTPSVLPKQQPQQVQQQQQQQNRRRGLAAPALSVPASSRSAGNGASSSSSSSAPVPIQPSASSRAPSNNSSSSASAAATAAASSAAVLVQPTRLSGGASTPVPIQPLPLAGSSANLAVAAMRRGLATEMQMHTFQQAFAQHAKQQQQQHQQQQQQQQHHQQQHHQQQLLEFLLQQQQLYIQMARYNQMQQPPVAGLPSPTYLAAAAAFNPASISVASQSPIQIQPVPTTDNSIKKQAAQESTPPQRKQGQAASSTSGGSSSTSRKSGEMPSASSSSPKKKITDIANSLHKKVSQQTMGGGNTASSSSNNNSAATAKSGGAVSSASSSSTSPAAAATTSAEKQQQHPPNAHTPTAPKTDVSGGAGSKGEDEPLNLVVARNGTCNGAMVTTTKTGPSATAVKVVGEKSS